MVSYARLSCCGAFLSSLLLVAPCYREDLTPTAGGLPACGCSWLVVAGYPLLPVYPPLRSHRPFHRNFTRRRWAFGLVFVLSCLRFANCPFSLGTPPHGAWAVCLRLRKTLLDFANGTP